MSEIKELNEEKQSEVAKNESQVNSNRSDREVKLKERSPPPPPPPLIKKKSSSSSSHLQLQKTQELEDEHLELLPEDKTQEMSPTEEKPEKSHPLLLFSEFSKRVEYKRKVDREVNVETLEAIDNDKTIRGEARFLKKIEKCKYKRLQRICVCPITRCYRVVDKFEVSKTFFHRLNRFCCVACCPPCFVIRKAAFWPPRCEYFFYKRLPGEQRVEVENEEDAVLMANKKKVATKFKKAKKCVLGETYTFALNHPCANDVENVQAFVVRTSMNNAIGCVYIKCPEGKARFTMLYSHPNGSDLSDHLMGVPNLLDLARFYRCDLYSYDYTGYGISRGSPSEKTMYSDIRAVYEHITITKKIPINKVVLLGYSIGSAATIELAKQLKDEKEKPAGIILMAPPTSLMRVMGHVLGKKKALTNPTCCMDRFTTIDKMKDITIPILVIHGEKDKTVPIAHGKLICERAVNRAAPEWVPAGSHDNIENCKEIWIRIRKFVKNELGLVNDQISSTPSAISIAPTAGK